MGLNQITLPVYVYTIVAKGAPGLLPVETLSIAVMLIAFHIGNLPGLLTLVELPFCGIH